MTEVEWENFDKRIEIHTERMGEMFLDRVLRPDGNINLKDDRFER